jgi:hypothetical protein
MSVPAGAMLGGPPPGMGAPPMGPPGLGGPPPAPADPVSQLSSAASGLMQAGQTAMMALAQLLGQSASPEAIGAQTSPGPLDAGPPPGAGPSPF